MILIVFFPLVCGFLLDSLQTTGNKTTTVGQYLTVSEFMGEKKLLDQETERLRHDMDRTFALLTSQMQQKLGETEQKYSLLEQKYSTLEQKYFALKQDVQDVTALAQTLSLSGQTGTNQSHVLYLLERKLQEIQEKENRSLGQLQKQIDANSEKVAMMSYVRGEKNVSDDEIIKFEYVIFSYGINNTQSYINTGKFICEKSGLYLISASIMSYTSGARYSIRKNDRTISDTLLGQHRGNTWIHTGTAVVVLQLDVGDNIWVQAADSWFIFAIWSKFAIVKIK